MKTLFEFLLLLIPLQAYAVFLLICQKGGTKAPAKLISKTGTMKLLFFTLIGVIVFNSKRSQNPKNL